MQRALLGIRKKNWDYWEHGTPTIEVENIGTSMLYNKAPAVPYTRLHPVSTVLL
jgi:hypothetical protein